MKRPDLSSIAAFGRAAVLALAIGAQPATAAARREKAPAAPSGPSAAVVGQIYVQPPAQMPPVVILRGDRTIDKVGNYALLEPKDRIYLQRRDAKVQLEVYGGQTIVLDGRRYASAADAYLVPDAAPGSDWRQPNLLRFLGYFPKAFDLPRTRPAALTTPNGPKGSGASEIRPFEILPASRQTLKIAPGPVVLPIVWDGGPALVRVTRECGLVVAEGTSSVRGFIALRASNLTPDDYCIDVWPVDGALQPNPKGGFTIPLRIVGGELPHNDEETAVLKAAAALRGPPEGRLQGLVDLEEQSRSSFKAWAVYRSIMYGQETGRAEDEEPVRRGGPPKRKRR